MLFGLGGVFVEVIGDVVFRALPVTTDDALDMIGSLKHPAVLDGVRGSPPVDREALAALLVGLSRIREQHPGIAEIDLNPVIAHAGGLAVVANAPSDLLASTFAIAAFAIVLVTDLVMVILWPGMLQGAHQTVWVSTAINGIACASYALKVRAGSALHATDLFGRALSLGRNVTWTHTLPLMTVLVLSLTDVSAQEACWRIFLAMGLVIVGFGGSVDLGAAAVPLSCALLCAAQLALTRLCWRLHVSLSESRSFAWQRQLLGLVVFVTLHLFPLIYACACALR
jgi:hypothetical protein